MLDESPLDSATNNLSPKHRNIAILAIVGFCLILTLGIIGSITPYSAAATSTGTFQSSTEQYDVTIQYHAKWFQRIYSQAPAGHVYLILTMQITNNAYSQGFYSNPSYFYVIINSIQYGYVSDTFGLINQLQDATIMQGGTLDGAVAFLVPYNAATGATPNFQPTYNTSFGTQPTINWIEA